ncbi:hypothetical protein Hypma_001655 [Hypsizygus marmoreus]|uniref:Uncharacterized protein n=1 Tax=Hypsizygus marmoreus TaxID=39966 RepID=A0A369JBN0_HYPMA|nr:hypothetical protein Hypma_001655 [Hypsizygus marmoreus]
MARAPSPAVQDDGDNLYSYFNKSVSAVQTHADQFEHDYARPALRTSQVFFDERPIAATFLAIFSVLSFLPVVSFIAFSVFFVVSFAVIALTCAFLASVTVVLTLLSLLVLTLLATTLSSAFLTSTALSLYSFTRLFSLVREHGRAGAFEWIEEMKGAIFSNLPIQVDAPRPEEREAEAYESDSFDPGEVLGGLAVEIKLEDSDDAAFTESRQETLISDDEVKAVE